jgi:hypothetical protein
VKFEVYSERPLSQRRKIKKVENKTWKNLKKSRNDTYIRMLENKIQTLEKEVSKQKSINKSNQDYIKKLSISEQIVVLLSFRSVEFLLADHKFMIDFRA